MRNFTMIVLMLAAMLTPAIPQVRYIDVHSSRTRIDTQNYRVTHIDNNQVGVECRTNTTPKLTSIGRMVILSCTPETK